MFRIRPLIQRRSSVSVRPSSQLRYATVRHGRAIGRGAGVASHWSDGRLETHAQYPLTSALRDVLSPNMAPAKKKRNKEKQTLTETRGSTTHLRTQIVSARLCDDILKYIGHTLEKHKGCDILDINPGAGLWSQKVHEFLQPRSHILLEPRYEKFDKFLGPLLAAPDTKYTLVDKDPCELSTFRQMVEEGLFPHQTRLEPGDPRAQKPNNTLLVIGSLAWDPILPGLGFDSMAKQLFHHFASAAWTNDLFHAFGLVRTLFWVPHDDFKAAIAQAIAGMQKANASLEMTANLNVVVNAEHTARGTGRGTIGREPQYEIESAIRALQAGRANGMDLPIHRRDHLHECAEDIENMSGSTGRTRSDVMQDYLYRRQLEGKSTQGLSTGAAVDHSNEERRLRETYPELYVELGGIASVKKKTLKHEPGYEELTAFWKARAHTVHITKLKQRIEAIADLGEDMYYLECKVLEMEDGSDKEAAMKRLEEMDEEWKQRLSSIPPNYGKAPVVEVDDRLALRAPPYPRLQWDRRPFEPLIMRSEEVWPRNRLSLVSAEPIPKPPAESSDWYDWVQDFVFGLYSEPSKSVIETLDKMQHGLSDIIKDCPSLKDPKKGGRLNMHHLRVRLLTQEMIKELVTAYKTWPFKKPGSDHNKYFRNHGSGQQWGGRP